MKKRKFIFLMVSSLILLSVAIISTYLASIYINYKFYEPPIVRDLLWEKLPYLNVFWLAELIIFLTVIHTVIKLIKTRQYNLILYIIVSFSLFLLARAVLMILTPLGFPNEGKTVLPIGDETVFKYGAFPSGHLSLPFIIFLVAKTPFSLIASILAGFFILISHQHYSIDLIGTLLLAYPIYKFSNRYLKRYFN